MTQDFDEDRQLCSDGACIGVIGPDGRCKVCGRMGVAGARGDVVAYEDDEDDDDDADANADDDADADADANADAHDEDEDEDDEDRHLCPDGSCIGLLGEDGRCKVCGKSAP
ncbi:MAG TPA: hypothetical protein VKE22_09085 [Haliangiales bacterium]|nr:hypothetical protein [Haliangiales bacterium]